VSSSPKEKYKIILADDHPIFRLGLRNLIEKDESLVVTEEFSNGEDLLVYLRKNKCDMTILDISMPKMDGIETAEIIKKNYPLMKILVLTTHDQKTYIKKIMAKGIDGYLLKTEVHDSLLTAIKAIQKGKKHISQKIVPTILDDYQNENVTKNTKENLTKREIEIIKLVAQGMTSRQVARELDISQRTVETHRYRIMEKLGLNTAAELIKFAVYEDII